MNQFICDTCRFFSDEDRTCRRNPPTYDHLDSYRTCFPTTSRLAWCGEHQLDTHLVTENNT
jgi:hypothetical protein